MIVHCLPIMRIEHPIWLSNKAAYRPVGPVYVTTRRVVQSTNELIHVCVLMFVCL